MVIYRTEIWAELAQIKDREALVAQIEQFGSFGVVVYAMVLILQVIVAAIPGQALVIAGGYFYGFFLGFLITHTCCVFGGLLCYSIARKYGRSVVGKLASVETIDKCSQRAERQGLAFFLFSFNIPIFPHDMMNYVAGLSGLSPKKFFIASFFGKLPGSILFTLIGSHGFEISPQFLLLAVVLTVILLIVWKLASPKVEQKFND
jgi:uncharacterized membrane protein YdjX (TVP38/TMEM64 family)